MYIKDVHILYYVLAVAVGFVMGQLADAISSKVQLKEHFSIKEYMLQIKKEFKLNYKLVVATIGIYLVLLYEFGINKGIIANIELMKYYMLTPILMIIFIIDYKQQIIPNRLTLLLFEIGLFFTFIEGLTNLNVMINMFLGLAVGGGIFLIITLISGIFAGKDAMGFGDVKFVATLGLCLGITNIVMISLLSFIIGAIMSLILIILKKKKATEYIAFGPAIVIATFVIMIVPFDFMTKILLIIFALKKV